MTLLELLLKDDFPIEDIEDSLGLDKLIEKMKITTYESIKVELTYNEFKAELQKSDGRVLGSKK